MHVTLLTPDSSYDQFRSLWESRIELYRDLLAPHGVELDPVPWTDATPVRPAWAQLAWGYHLQPARWDALLAAWPEDVLMLNPAALLRWNSDKIYLADLAAAGVSTVPTVFAEVAHAEALTAARAELGADALVVKPRISASANSTSRVMPGDPAPNLACAMIQPFLPSVQEAGELSIFYFGGARAHAVRKVAAAGDFRVQREYGGAFTVVEPDAGEIAVAEAALAAAPVAPVYARVDMAPDAQGRPSLMELELIEPDLYLDLAPDRGQIFAGAFARALAATLT